MEEPKTQIRDEGGLNWFTFRPNKGKRIDILMPIEEGARYRLGTITFTGNKAVNNEQGPARHLRRQGRRLVQRHPDQQGPRQPEEGLRAAWATSTSAPFPSPSSTIRRRPSRSQIDIDEGKQFYVSRIEFQGNTITRDRVIRRELMLDEGQVYNSQLWEYSLLRLNQLEYFEPLKVDQDSEAHQDPEAGTVDLLLKVKEKGKNSIGLNGGVSGLSGAFLGVNYQTNNFLGLGETLSVQGNLGNVSRQFLFGFSQPYVHNRPLNVGFQIFNHKQDFNAAKNYQATTGQAVNLTAAQQIADAELQPGLHRLELLGQLSAEAPCVPAAGLHLFADQVVDHGVQHRFADVLPDHQLPLRHPGLQCAERDHQQRGVVHLHLQHRQ